MIKAKGETEDDMQTVTLTKKQSISRLNMMRKDRTTNEMQLIDNNEKVILRVLIYGPQTKDKFGKFKADSKCFEILEGNFFMYFACERHENHLFCFSIGFTNSNEILN